MTPVCHVVCAGDFDKKSFSPRREDFVIACDAGLEYLKDCGREPDLIVGDFDSHEGVPSGNNVVVLPREKDDTDSAYAMKAGLSEGYLRFILHGALGGARISHSLANISLLLFLKEQGAKGLLCGVDTCAALLERGGVTFGAKQRGYLSLFAVTPTCKVKLENLKFPFSGDLIPSFPLGVSNEFIGSPARVESHEGTLLWICEGDIGDPAKYFDL